MTSEQILALAAAHKKLAFTTKMLGFATGALFAITMHQVNAVDNIGKQLAEELLNS